MSAKKQIVFGLVLIGIVANMGCASLPEDSNARAMHGTVAQRYEATVPETLDLAERAKMAINSLTGAADVDHNYENYTSANLHVNPPFLSHRAGGPCQAKAPHVLPMMRIMSGSTQNADYDLKMLNAIVSMIEKDGIWWLKAEGRPWDGEPYGGDVACLGQQGRLMVCLMDWYKYDGNKKWLEITNTLAEGLARQAKMNGDHAWFNYFISRSGAEPNTGVSWDLMFADRKSSDTEPASPDIYANGLVLRGFIRWYEVSRDKKYLEISQKIASFMMKAFTGPNTFADWPTMVAGTEKGMWAGHFHSWTMGMIGLAEYAIISNDVKAKQIVKGFYEYARMQGISRIGFFPGVVDNLERLRGTVTKNYGEFNGQCCEGCSIGDMTWLAVALSEAGIGDYWEDVDCYVRNQMVESQWLNRDLLQAIVDAGTESKIDPRMTTTKNVVDRCVGGFTSITDPTWAFGWYTMCCNANIPHGMYKAWDSIVRPVGDGVQVNLLMNRASKWIDIESYQPYEGKVVLRNKMARKAYIRVPAWADKKAVAVTVDGKRISNQWIGNYLVIDRMINGAVVTVTFPMVETVEKYTEMSYAKTYTCKFKGNTLIDISPRGDKLSRTVDLSDDGHRFAVSKGYPIYQRDHYNKNIAPFKKTTIYIAPRKM